jgi:predicted nucleic acid-binding protein
MMEIILDTSVIIKWFVMGENGEKNAMQIFNDICDEKIALVEPKLLFYEFNNVMNTLVKRGIKTKDVAIKDVVSLKNLLFGFHGFAEDIFHGSEILYLSLSMNLSSYDGTYVFLSQLYNIPFYTANEKLVAKVKKSHSMVNLLQNYHIQ